MEQNRHWPLEYENPRHREPRPFFNAAGVEALIGMVISLAIMIPFFILLFHRLNSSLQFVSILVFALGNKYVGRCFRPWVKRHFRD